MSEEEKKGSALDVLIEDEEVVSGSALNVLLGEGETPPEEDEPINEHEYVNLGPLEMALHAGGNFAEGAMGMAKGAAKFLNPIDSITGEGSGPIDTLTGKNEDFNRGLNALSQVPGVVADEFEADPVKTVVAGAKGAGEVLSSGIGATIGGVLGAGGGPLGIALGAAGGAGGGKLAWDGFLKQVDRLVGGGSKPVKESIGEAMEVSLAAGLGSLTSQAGKVVKQGRSGISRAARDAAERGARSRSTKHPMRLLFSKYNSSIDPDDLDDAVGLLSDDVVKIIANDPNRKNIVDGDIFRSIRNVLRGSKKGEGLIDDLGREVHETLSHSSKKYTIKDARNLLKKSANESVKKKNKFAKVRGILKDLDEPLVTAYADKADLDVDKYIKQTRRLKKINETLSLKERAPSGTTIGSLKDERKRLIESIDEFNDALSRVEMDPVEFWETTKDVVQPDNINFGDIDITRKNQIASQYRLQVQNSLKEGLPDEMVSAYELQNKRYQAGLNMEQWAKDSINREGQDAGVMFNTFQNTKRTIRKASPIDLSEQLQATPKAIRLLELSEDALLDNTQGRTTFFRGLARMISDDIPSTAGLAVEEMFSPAKVAAFERAAVLTEEYLQKNPVPDAEAELGLDTAVRFSTGLGKLVTALKGGVGKSESEQRDIINDLAADKDASLFLSFDEGGELMKGVKAISGKPLSQEDEENYRRNIALSDLDQFEKSKRIRHLNEKGIISPEPDEPETDEVDEAEVDKQVQLEKAREDIFRFRSSKDTAKNSQLSSLLDQKKNSRSGLTLVGYTDPANIPITWDDYTEALGRRESSNNYKAINKIGFVGKYQFGIAALIDAGFIKPEFAKSGNKALRREEVWKKGLSLDEFLDSPELQEEAMRTYTERNYKTLKRLKVIDSASTPEEVAGALAAAHLKGPGGAKKYLLDKKDNADQFGTKASEYFNLGKKSQRKSRVA